MPIYEYECMECGRHEEVIQKFSDKPLTKCAHCSGKLQKLISQSTFHLKGSGWYVTDYADKKKHSPSAPDSGSDGSAKDATKKAEKTAAKTSAKSD